LATPKNRTMSRCINHPKNHLEDGSSLTKRGGKLPRKYLLNSRFD
jgi:hypothetical protein